MSKQKPQDLSEELNNEDRLPIPREIPILPIRNEVAFPDTIMTLTVARKKSQTLLEQVLGGDKLIGVVAQRSSKIEDPELDDLYRVGTICQVLKLLKLPDETETIVVQGHCRFGIEELTQVSPFWAARVNPHYDSRHTDTEMTALMSNVRQIAGEVIERSPNVPEEALMVVNSIEVPGALADFLAANLSLGLIHKQEFLETFDIRHRLIKVNTALLSQLEVLQVSEKLHSEVKAQIDKTQREYYLHEQLKAIRKELGEEDARDHELKKLSKKIKHAGMNDEAESEALRELERLGNIPQGSQEYSLALDYINWLCELPWSIATEDRLDLLEAEKILNQDHHDLDHIKKRILEYLAVRKLNPHGQGPILCFAGPPGVGKTSLGRSIARAMGRQFIRMSLGGAHDEADIRGHRRTYVGSLPGRIIKEIRRAGSNNPVFMLDEVDKIGKDFRGDPASALLEVLDPQQNSTFTDHYLSVPFDLSHVLFIATANYMDPIPPALLDRMEVLQLSGYTQEEKLAIAKKYLVPRQIRENGLTRKIFKIDVASLRQIIDGYTREAGVRNLERQIGAVCRGAAVQYAKGKKDRFAVKVGDVEKYLGSIKFESEVAQRTSVPGVVTALAFTPVGGEILFVEASRMSGSGDLLLTGQVGSVMKESAHAGFSLLRSRAKSWGIPENTLDRSDLHIHVPAGAIPKDGPSAGVAMLVSMVSILSDRPVRPNVAMTGEITLRGLILPVGGIREKALAAYRAGIRWVLLPKRNERDLVDLPPEVHKRIEFKPVADIDAALDAVFRSKSRTSSRIRDQRPTSKRSKDVKTVVPQRRAKVGVRTLKPRSAP